MGQLAYIPIVSDIHAFDPAFNYTIRFSCGGFQSAKYKITIKDTYGQTMYNIIVASSATYHVLPANTLYSTNSYTVTVQCYDAYANSTAPSYSVLFWCFTTPTFEITNVTPYQIITSPVYDFIIGYSQTEGDELNSYTLSVYDSDNKLAFEAKDILDTTALTVHVSGLLNEKTYSVILNGVTMHGLSILSAPVSIIIRYMSLSSSSVIALENDQYHGTVKLTSNIVAIRGTSHPSNPAFIGNGVLDLTNDATNPYVVFDNGFSINNDFVINIIVQNLQDNTVFVTLSNQYNTIELKYCVGIFDSQYVDGSPVERSYIELKSSNSLTSYVTSSNYFSVLTDYDSLHIYIKNIRNIFDIIATVIGGA